ncbi:trypsin-like peptidase domain-containing protein [Lachnospiraceae bacterium JLR.KK008]
MTEQQKETEQQTEQAGIPQYDFIKEQIKERPLNKKKLLRRTIITASMAVLFGLVACLTVLILEPVFSNWLYPEEIAENITFPPETEEMLPEDMALDDEELEQEQEKEERPEIIPKEEDDELNRYRKTFREMQELAAEVSKSLVTVTGVTSDKDWFDNTYESKGQTTGVIVASNNREYLILTDAEPLKTVETINVTFCEDTQVQAEIKMTDPITGLAVLSIDSKLLGSDVLDGITTANLGSSNYAALTGSPVIALGSPAGMSGSIMYGVVTSGGNTLNTVDSKYKLITTDMYGSQSSTGVLVNLQGQIIGIIEQDYNDSQMKNMIAAFGISELKNTIERLSNGIEQAYIGIYGTDVTEEANENLQVPFGAYVTGIEMDSPAMQAGIQSGDVIVRLNGKEVGSYEEYISVLSECIADSTVGITIVRKNQEEYKSMNLQITLGTLK